MGGTRQFRPGDWSENEIGLPKISQKASVISKPWKSRQQPLLVRLIILAVMFDRQAQLPFSILFILLYHFIFHANDIESFINSLVSNTYYLFADVSIYI